MTLALATINIPSATLVALLCLGLHASSSEIDFSQIPECAWSNCFPYHSSSIGCPKLTQDCFCNALKPINCASSNCTGNDWYAVEEWFATQCPDPANVTFSGLPECSRACIREAIIPTYCMAQITRNCFCRLENEFEGLAPCLQTGCNETEIDANNTLVAYFRETCIYDPDADGSGDPGDSSSGQSQGEVITSPDGSPGGSSNSSSTGSGGNVDKLQLGIGLASGFAALISCCIGFWVWLHRSTGRRIFGGNFFDPPPPYEE